MIKILAVLNHTILNKQTICEMNHELFKVNWGWLVNKWIYYKPPGWKVADRNSHSSRLSAMSSEEEMLDAVRQRGLRVPRCWPVQEHLVIPKAWHRSQP